MLNRRNITWLIPLFLLIAFPIWKVPVTKFLTPRGGFDPETETVASQAHDFVMEYLTIIQSQDGRKTATIRADKGQTAERKDEYLLTNVNADIINNDGETTNVVALTGTYNTISQVLILKNDVVVTRLKDNQKMFTDHLIYSDADKTVVSPDKTEFTGDAFHVIGGNMHYEIDKESYILSKRVKCVINTSEPL